MIATRSCAIEAENLPQVTAEVADVVADAAHAELAEVREVLADLRGVQVELFGERLRRNGANARLLELIQAAQVDRQPIGRELGDLFGHLAGSGGHTRPFVRSFHKRVKIVAKTAGRG